MARQSKVGIEVQSQNFQRFAKEFNALSGQIKQLNANFQAINATLNRTNILLRGIAVATSAVLAPVRSLGREIVKITKQFLSWGTIISGITALLGMGGALFGIERLAASIMQKRRQAMGLGQDYGTTQAASIFGQSIMKSPMNAMQNIALGMHGSEEQFKSLLKLGIDPTRDRRPTEEIMNEIVKKIPTIMNQGGPGKELMYAKQYGLTNFWDPMTLMALSTKKGQQEWAEQQKLIDQYKKLTDLSPKVQRAWAMLSIQLQAAGAQMQSFFGERLADLAGPLQHLSEGFTHLVEVLMQSPEIQRLIKGLGDGIEWLANQLKTLTRDQIDAFIKKLEGWLPTMDQFKSAIKILIDGLNDLATVLRWFRPIAGAIAGFVLGGAVAGPIGAVAGAIGGGAAGLAAQRAAEKAAQTPSTTAPAPTTAPPSTTTPAPAPTTVPSAPAANKWTGAPKFGLGDPTVPGFKDYGTSGNLLQTYPGAESFNWANTLGGVGGLPSGATRGAIAKSTSSANTGTSFADRFGAWPNAATKMIPQTRGSSPSQMMHDEPAMRGDKLGPLSMNNWQMNRTANLVVRNVPGSNIFMTAAGMTG